MRKSEIRELNSRLADDYGTLDMFNPKGKVVIDGDMLFEDGSPAFFKYDEKWLPTIKTLLKNQFLKKVTVDMGAVKFVVNGADIMRPGVTKCDEGVTRGDAIVIVDENNGKPLSVGIALFDAKNLMAQSGGKVVKNLHYVGDDIWNA